MKKYHNSIRLLNANAKEKAKPFEKTQKVKEIDAAGTIRQKRLCEPSRPPTTPHCRKSKELQAI